MTPERRLEQMVDSLAALLVMIGRIERYTRLIEKEPRRTMVAPILRADPRLRPRAHWEQGDI